MPRCSRTDVNKIRESLQTICVECGYSSPRTGGCCIKGGLGSLSLWQFISGFGTAISKTQNHKAENRTANRALRSVLCM